MDINGLNFKAGEDFQGRHHVFVKFNSNGDVVTCAANETPIGILQDSSPKLGESGFVAISDVCQVMCGDTITAGSLLKVGANGRAVTTLGGNGLVRIQALQNGTAGNLILCNYLGAVANPDRILPSGVTVDFTNKCNYIMSQDGLILTSLDTSGQANAAGSFNGSGTGQKLFVSFNNYHNVPLSQLTNFNYVAKVMTGSNNQLFANMQVDLAGNGQSADYALLVPQSNTASVIGTTNTNQLFPMPSGNIWGAVGGTGANGGSPVAGKAGIPATGVGTCTLTHILTYNPNAKLINVALLDGGQPRNTILGAIQIVMNSSSANVHRKNCIYSCTINNDVYQFGSV